MPLFCRFFVYATALGVVGGCTPDRDEEQGATGITSVGDGTGASGDGPSSGGPTGGEKYDVGGATDGVPCEEGGDCPQCEVPTHVPCDQGTTDLFNVIGLNCPNESPVTGSVAGDPGAMGIRSFFGNTPTWTPTEGSYMAVLGSGLVADLDLQTPALDPNADPTHCNDELAGSADPGAMLPPPLMVNDVAGDCTTDPSLLGTGDCSGTIQGQFSQGGGAFDYTEMRFTATVPMMNNSISYDFAFFSTEYPFYYGSAFNDMYVGWLSSESWTGNISFDDNGNPISLNAGFLDYRDDGGNLAEFDGTCMKKHAGTKWLQSIAPVTPGEQITVVFAIFDLSDPILDSYVFIDNFWWGCEGTDKPSTKPIG